MSPTGTPRDGSIPESRVLEPLLANYAAFLRFVERRVGACDVAEDIVQETFMRNLERVAALRDSEAVVGWFYRALRNAIADYFRRATRVDRAEAQLARESEATAPAPESTLARACQCATRAKAELKPDYADALQRLEIEGATLAGFAAERGISSTNAAVRVHRARAALRHELEATCGSSAAQGCTSCACDAAEPR